MIRTVIENVLLFLLPTLLYLAWVLFQRSRTEVREGDNGNNMRVTQLLDDAPRTLRILRTLRQHGILAQLDDFGTGFSALSYLHRFPISVLKIDRSFVSGLGNEARPESLALVRAILALASTLGIETIAEGVETEEQRQALLDLGCHLGQGYLLGRPAAQMDAIVAYVA